MGNHDVGRALNSAAKGFWAGHETGGMQPPNKEEALKFLDAVCEDWRGSDAEFDDCLQPDEPLGRLLIIAFGPWTGKDAPKNDTYWDSYHNEIEEPFSQRYDFC
jgi:hypothetical protein